MISGIGVDIIEIKRIERAIEKWGDHFLSHVFCDEEIEYAKKNKHPAQHFAVRLAAKEAVFKAIGDKPDIGWKDIKIMNDKYGKPICIYNDKKFKNKILVSLSHTENYAVANAIISSE